MVDLGDCAVLFEALQGRCRVVLDHGENRLDLTRFFASIVFERVKVIAGGGTPCHHGLGDPARHVELRQSPICARESVEQEPGDEMVAASLRRRPFLETKLDLDEFLAEWAFVKR